MEKDPKPEKVYVETFMTEGDENDNDDANLEIQKALFDDAKENFDIEEAMNSFIIKKDYFVSHKDGSIFKDYIIDEKAIGEGGFGTVFKGHERETNELRAIKKIPYEKIINYQSVVNEVTALKNLDHPNIIKLYEVYEDEG